MVNPCLIAEIYSKHHETGAKMSFHTVTYILRVLRMTGVLWVCLICFIVCHYYSLLVLGAGWLIVVVCF